MHANKLTEDPERIPTSSAADHQSTMDAHHFPTDSQKERFGTGKTAKMTLSAADLSQEGKSAELSQRLEYGDNLLRATNGDSSQETDVPKNTDPKGTEESRDTRPLSKFTNLSTLLLVEAAGNNHNTSNQGQPASAAPRLHIKVHTHLQFLATASPMDGVRFNLSTMLGSVATLVVKGKDGIHSSLTVDAATSAGDISY
jgi:hypothetical protein